MTPINQNNNKSATDEISLKKLISHTADIFRYLLSKWLIIFVVGMLGASLGFFFAKFRSPTYFASTSFVLEDGGGGAGLLGQYAGIASMVGIDVGGGGGLFSGDNIIELYKSRTMLKSALLSSISTGNRGLLIDRYIQANELRNSWNQKPKLKDISFKDSAKFTVVHDSLISKIIKDINQNYLSVGKPDKKLSIIKVEVRSKDEIFAKEFADKIVSTVNKFYIDTRTKRSMENVSILQYQKDSVQAVMNGAILSSAAVLDATPNLNPTRQALRAPVQRAQFNAEANKAILTELVKNLELSKITLRKETPLIQVIDYPVFPLENDKIGKAKGIITGGLLAGFLIVFILVLKRIFQNLLNQE